MKVDKNCGLCGEKSCADFRKNLEEGKKVVEDCPFHKEDLVNNQGEFFGHDGLFATGFDDFEVEIFSQEVFDKEIENFVKNKQNCVKIVNKSDLKRILSCQENEIEVSALKEDNIRRVKETIYSMIFNEEIDFNKSLIVNTRQSEILRQCKGVVDQILSAQEESMDIIAMLLKNLWNTLGKITGECENENIIDLIFSKFCLGK